MSASSQSIIDETSLGDDQQQCRNYSSCLCQGKGEKRKSLTMISHSIEDENDHQKEDEKRIVSLNQAIVKEERSSQNDDTSADDDADILRLASQLERAGPRVRFDSKTLNQAAPKTLPCKRRRYMRRNSFVIHRNQRGGAGSMMLGNMNFNSTPSSSLYGIQEENRTPETQASQDATLNTTKTVQNCSTSSNNRQDDTNWLNLSPMSFDSKHTVIAKPLVGKSPLGSDDLMKPPEIRLSLKKSSIRLPTSSARLFVPRGA